MKFLNVNSYRYGYQGEYAEDETEENRIKTNSFQLRLYNPRLGRWLSPDPKHQYFSPYLAMGNNPISRVDPDGGNDGWVEGEGTGIYWDGNINSASEASAAGVKWHGMSGQTMSHVYFNNGEMLKRSILLDEVTLAEDFDPNMGGQLRGIITHPFRAVFNNSTASMKIEQELAVGDHT